MKSTYLIVAICCASSLCGCGEEKQVSDFDYSEPTDLSKIINWYHTYQGEDKDSILCTMIAMLMPERYKLDNSESNSLEGFTETHTQSNIERKDTLGLLALYPQFRRIDLVCGTEPSKNDTSVVLFAEAAYTGECLKVFKHSNIAGDHVSGGKRYKGYRCKRNGGAFVYYNRKWKFCHRDYSHELDSAAQNSGAAFAQELIIHNGKSVLTTRENGNKNQFRALCEHNGRLCIIESESVMSFGTFRQKLLGYGVLNAIYLDMGSGWNYAWYRNGKEIVELHPKTHSYCTNWITFYK